MNTRSLRNATMACFAALLALSFAVEAEVTNRAESFARAYVSDLRGDILNVLDSTEAGSSDRQARLSRLFNGAMNGWRMAEMLVGAHWDSMSDFNRDRFAEAVPAYLSSLFARYFADYEGQSFEITGSTMAAQGEVVHARISGGGMIRPTMLDITIGCFDGAHIRDVAIDGISVVAMKRAEFESVIRRKSTDTVLRIIGQTGGGD